MQCVQKHDISTHVVTSIHLIQNADAAAVSVVLVLPALSGLGSGIIFWRINDYRLLSAINRLQFYRLPHPSDGLQNVGQRQ